MKAMLTYIRLISADVPAGQSAEGGARRHFPCPPRPAILGTARRYSRRSARYVIRNEWIQGLRWGAGGSGTTASLLQFPPLWGPDGYNDGAGMARLITAASFIRANDAEGTSNTITLC